MRAFVLAVLFLTASQAHAALITWEFEAIVRATLGTPGFGDAFLFHTGQVLSGSLTFETTTPDIVSSPGTGSYVGAVTSLHVEYLIGIDPYPPGPFTLGDAAGPGDILVVPLGLDREFLRSTLDPSTFDYQGGLGTTVTGVQLVLAGSGMLPSDQMLLSPPLLSTLEPFDLTGFLNASVPRTGLYLNSPSSTFVVGAELTALSAVPEPALSALALVTLLALACARLAFRGSIAA